VRDNLLHRDPRPGRREARFEHPKSLRDHAGLQPRKHRRDHADAHWPEWLNRNRGRWAQRRERSLERSGGSCKRNDLDGRDHVAIGDCPIWRQGRDGDRLVDRIDFVDGLGPDDRQPRRLGEQVDPSRERRGAAQIHAGEALGERERRLVLADVSMLEPRRNDALNGRRRQSQPALVGEDVALLELSAVDPHPVRENGSLGFLDRGWAEFHAAALSARSGFLRSEATISPMIETAISAGLTAPMSSPIGA
jgi:hypothetical protein